MQRPGAARFDAVVACGFALVAVSEALLATPERDPLAFVVVSAGLLAAPLLVRRRRPLAALAGVLGVMVVQRLVLGEIWDAGSSLAIPMCAVYSAAAYLPLWHGAAAGAVAVTVTSVADVGEDGSDWPFLTLLFGAMWVAGRAARSYRELAERAEAYAAQLQELQAEREQAAVRTERARIARELHDVVAHCVSTMVVQAEAGQALLYTAPDRAHDSLAHIQATGRQALVELRRLLGLLRGPAEGPDGSPQPGLADVEALVADIRRTGLQVTLEVGGRRRPLPSGVDLSAYRIVQESLTNTVKHARARRAVVVLHYGEEDLAITVEDDGAGAGAMHPGGHGLVGMAERAHLLGGTLDTRLRSGGGYAVHARLPLR